MEIKTIKEFNLNFENKKSSIVYDEDLYNKVLESKYIKSNVRCTNSYNPNKSTSLIGSFILERWPEDGENEPYVICQVVEIFNVQEYDFYKKKSYIKEFIIMRKLKPHLIVQSRSRDEEMNGIEFRLYTYYKDDFINNENPIIDTKPHNKYIYHNIDKYIVFVPNYTEYYY